jgi:putative oligomerization/nucleic acid binding protein
MGLLGGMARTAVVAGTATAVSNRVSRRQANRWAAQEPQQQYQEPVYQAPPPPPAPPAAAPAAEAPDMLGQLEKLGQLKAAGVLTEEEFATQKARILAG